MSQHELRRAAADSGLPKLDGKFLEEFGRSIEVNRDTVKLLPKDLHWSEESSLVFQLPSSVAGGRK